MSSSDARSIRIIAPVASLFAIAALFGSTLLAGATAVAGGFHSPYQSTTAIGSAFAGASARSDDAGFFLYNPASIAKVTSAQSFVDVRAFFADVRITANEAVSPLGTPLLAEGDSGNLMSPALAPGSVSVVPLAHGVVLGLGSSAPFATDAETRSSWAGRFHLQKSYMVGTSMTGAISWQATPSLALAGGVQIQRMENQFANSAVVPLGGGVFASTGAFLEATSWGAGAVAGLLWTPTEGSHIGLSWRSAMTHRMKGRTGAALAGLPIEHVRYDLDLPHHVTLGLEQRLDHRWRLFAEWQWTGWQRFQGFEFSFTSGRPQERRQIAWENTWLAALGVGYRISSETEVTLGIALDKGASKDGSGSTLSPDSDKIIAGIGIIQDVPGIGRFSLSYGRLMLEPGPVKASNPASGTLEGRLSGHVDMIGAGYTYNW